MSEIAFFNITPNSFQRNTGYKDTAYALSEIVDIPIVVKVDDMEIAEDSQLIIFHYLKQKLLKRLVKNDNKEIMPKYLKRTLNDLVS